jgi:hypothetical protein
LTPRTITHSRESASSTSAFADPISSTQPSQDCTTAIPTPALTTLQFARRTKSRQSIMSKLRRSPTKKCAFRFAADSCTSQSSRSCRAVTNTSTRLTWCVPRHSEPHLADLLFRTATASLGVTSAYSVRARWSSRWGAHPVSFNARAYCSQSSIFSEFFDDWLIPVRAFKFLSSFTG